MKSFNEFIEKKKERKHTITGEKPHCVEDSSLSLRIPVMDEILEGLPLPSEERALGDSCPLEYQRQWCYRL